MRRGTQHDVHPAALPVPTLLLALLLPPTGSGVQELALRGGTVLTAAGPPIENATILAPDGKIAAVGVNVSLPAGVRVVDVAGKQVIPGMLDNHSHIRFDIRDVNERGTRFAPRSRISDVLSPDGWYWNDAVTGAASPSTPTTR